MDYEQVTDTIGSLDSGQFDTLTQRYREFVRGSENFYGAPVAQEPVSADAPLEGYDTDIGMFSLTVGAIRSGMEDREDGEEFVRYLEEDLRQEEGDWDVATVAVVEQVFSGLLDDLGF